MKNKAIEVNGAAVTITQRRGDDDMADPKT